MALLDLPQDRLQLAADSLPAGQPKIRVTLSALKRSRPTSRERSKIL